MENQVNKGRKEDKYTASISKYNHIKKNLLKMGFKKAHSSNFVNNIYYDFENNCFNENIEGESSRIKYRVRWYDYKKDYIFEKKIKKSRSGYKIRSKIIASNYYEMTKKISKLLPKKYKEVIKNRYYREYFVRENIRATIDSRIKFSSPNSNIFKSYNDIILEIKYPIFSFYDDKIIKKLGLKLVKFSKFAEGIIFLNQRNN